MIKTIAGSLAALLLCSNAVLAQVTLGPPQTPIMDGRARLPVAGGPPAPVDVSGAPSGTGPVDHAPAAATAPSSADPRPRAAEPAWTGPGESADLFQAGPEWRSARTSYYWFRAEYLNWWIKPGPLPVPLVTTGPATALNPGALSDPATHVLLGGSSLGYGAIPGVRFTTGLWVDTDQTTGMEFGGFLLATGVTRTRVSSDANGNPILSVPVLNAVNAVEDTSPIAIPAVFSGSAALSSTSTFWGTEANLLHSMWRCPDLQFNAIAGFRYLGLRESLEFTQNSAPLPGSTESFNNMTVAPPDGITIPDRFATSNQFYGGQLGAQLDFCSGRVFVSAVGKLGLGLAQQTVTVNGISSLNVPGQPSTNVPGGFLAVSSNSGSTTRNQLALVPEGGLRVGYQLTSHLSVSLGYTCIYWSDVVRPGEQIDRTINPTLVPTTAVFGVPVDAPQRPTLTVQRTDYWAHGITFAVTWDY